MLLSLSQNQNTTAEWRGRGKDRVTSVRCPQQPSRGSVHRTGTFSPGLLQPPQGLRPGGRWPQAEEVVKGAGRAGRGSGRGEGAGARVRKLGAPGALVGVGLPAGATVSEVLSTPVLPRGREGRPETPSSSPSRPPHSSTALSSTSSSFSALPFAVLLFCSSSVAYLCLSYTQAVPEPEFRP